MSSNFPFLAVSSLHFAQLLSVMSRRYTTNVLSILYLVITVVSALHIPHFHNTTSNCTSPRIRREWRTLTIAEQHAYLASQRCLFNLPPRLDLGSHNRWEDLVTLHQNLTDVIHENGPFLSWHRYFLHIHETVTRTECNYTGPMTWWDERLDAGHFAASPLFLPSTFGSLTTNNLTLVPGGIYEPDPGPCVTDGYFANTTLHIGYGPRSNNTAHCLNRNVADSFSNIAVQAMLLILSATTQAMLLLIAVTLTLHIRICGSAYGLLVPTGPDMSVSEER